MSQAGKVDGKSVPPNNSAERAAREFHKVLRSLSGSGASGRPLNLPASGDELFSFRLRQELGRGAFARVFLAEQADLARRPVVLKVSGISGHEPQTLAQMQHTHIVPIHSVHEDPEKGLRAVCMPYFGGASLSQVLRALWNESDRDKKGNVPLSSRGQSPFCPGPPTHGEQLLAALAQVGAKHEVRGRKDEGLREETPSSAVLSTLSFVDAAVWIVARLAEALQHAHQRGVLHRDIKPSNILLAADGQPMLLDFNLSQNPHSGYAQASAILGGTVAYMAPEHLRALATRDPDLARLVDRRSDIYALGMVLYEMLAGCKPFDKSGSYSPALSLIEAMALERSRAAPSLKGTVPFLSRRAHARQPATGSGQKGDCPPRRHIPWSLESITRKCLAPKAADRYQQAEDLAEDLRRFLEDRPLKYAPELSRAEQVRKWTRRHPRLSSSASVATVATFLLVAAGGALFGVHGHLASTRAELQVVQAQDRKRAYEEGTIRALCLVNMTSAMRDHLAHGLAVCEQTLALYGVLDQDDWQQHPDWQQLDEADRQRLAEDTRELLLLLAGGRVHQAMVSDVGASCQLARPGKLATCPHDPGVLRDALALLDRAEAIRGLEPSRALWEARAAYLDQLGDGPAAQAAREAAGQIPAATARDHYLLATASARNGRYPEAVEELNRALELNPRHYWSMVQMGICHQEMGKYFLAASDFGECIGLWPEFAWGYFNRGYAKDQGGHKVEAIKDYSAALKRDPDFILAYLNRGMACLELKRYQQALSDLQKAADLGHEEAPLHAARGAALEGLGRWAEADAAFQEAFRRGEAAPKDIRARICLVYGFAVVPRLPEKARKAFDEVLREHAPGDPRAVYGRAMVEAEQGAVDEALTLFNRALEIDPNFVEARRFRAILLARRGRFDSASQDICWCLEKERDAGATLYAAACVSALAAEKSTYPSAAHLAGDQAIAFLQKAIDRGYGQDKAARDPDLRGIWKHPAFAPLVQN